MKSKVVFHSLYTEPGLSNLKHALLYHGQLIVLDESNLVIPDKSDGDRARWLQLIPDHARRDLKFLEEQGFVQVEPPSETEPILEFVRAIDREKVNDHQQKIYKESEIAPLFESLDLSTSSIRDIKFASEISILIAAMHLKAIAGKNWVPCFDSMPLFDDLALGFRSLYHAFLRDADFTNEELRELKSQFIAPKIFSLYLPAFDFHSFDDVLEIRSRLEGIAPLHEALLGLSDEVESSPWEDKFESEVQEVIGRLVKPRLQELEREAKFSASKVARSAAGTACVLTLQGLVPDIIDSVFLGLNAIALREVFQRERERVRKIRLENSFSTLLQIRDLK